MNSNGLIGIVTVLYNSAPVLKEFFESLEHQSYKNFVLFVVDNKSTDNSVPETKQLMKNVNFKTILIEEQENWGVAKGNNIGIKAALKYGCDFVLLSNNDIVLEINTIEVLLKELLDNKVSMIVPKIYFWNTNKIIWAAGGYFQTLDCTTRHTGYRKKDSSIYNIIKEVKYSPTCFMLIEKSLFERIGYMDENYFVYCDDADFLWRSTIIGNERLLYCPSSIVWHKESFSTGGKLSDFSVYYVTRNRVYFAYKHFTLGQRYILYFALLAHVVVKDLWVLSWKQLGILKKGFLDGLKLSKSIV